MRPHPVVVRPWCAIDRVIMSTHHNNLVGEGTALHSHLDVACRAMYPSFLTCLHRNRAVALAWPSLDSVTSRLELPCYVLGRSFQRLVSAEDVTRANVQRQLEDSELETLRHRQGLGADRSARRSVSVGRETRAREARAKETDTGNRSQQNRGNALESEHGQRLPC
jgi:hypothetical protein